MTGNNFKVLSFSDPRWTNWGIDQPETNIFHHPAWMETLRACYGYQPGVFAVLGPDGIPIAALPYMNVNSWITGRRMVSLPFSDFVAPLSTDETSLKSLVEGLRTWRSQNRASDLFVHWPLPQAAGVFPANEYASHITALTSDSQQVFDRFAKTQVQQRIRKAEREGVNVLMSDRWEDMQLFYGLHLNTRRRLGTPVQPARFFRLVWEKLISQGLGFVLLAYKESTLLAGAVFFHFNKTLTYKYSASEPEFWNLRPNNILLWHAIRWGCEQGYHYFDWGRTELSNAGLREFKLGWGVEERILHYSVLADRPSTAVLNGKAEKIFSPLIKNSPVWVCRILGELFYHHFGM